MLEFKMLICLKKEGYLKIGYQKLNNNFIIQLSLSFQVVVEGIFIVIFMAVLLKERNQLLKVFLFVFWVEKRNKCMVLERGGGSCKIF